MEFVYFYNNATFASISSRCQTPTKPGISFYCCLFALKMETEMMIRLAKPNICLSCRLNHISIGFQEFVASKKNGQRAKRPKKKGKLIHTKNALKTKAKPNRKPNLTKNRQQSEREEKKP